MADPVFATVAEMYAFGVDTLDEPEKSYTADVDDTLEALRNDLEGDFSQDTVAGINFQRATVVAQFGREAARLRLSPIVSQWTESAGIKPKVGNPAFNWREVFDFAVDNSQSVNSRNWTFGTPVAGGSNVGDATVARLDDDEENEPMEAWWPDTYTLEAITDFLTSGTEHISTWRLRGTASGPDGFPFQGAPFEEFGIPQHSDLTTVGLSNPSFDLGTFSEPTITALTSWTTGTGGFTNLEIDSDSTRIFLDTTASGATAFSLRFTDNEHIFQELQETGGFRLVEDVPWRFGIYVFRRDSCDGTFTIRLTDVTTPTSGGVSRAVTITTLADNAYTFIDLTPTFGQNNWPKNFRIEQLCITHQLSGRTTGSIHLDTAIHSTWTRVGANGQTARGRGTNGVYIHILAGQSQTIKEDLFTWTDSEGARATNQFWSGLHGANYGYLPSDNAAGETILDK